MKSANTKYLVIFFLSIVLVLSLSACGGGGAPAATAAPAGGDGAAAPASGDIVAKFVFTNTGTLDICQLYLSPVSKDEWGPDQLQGQKIVAGDKFTLTNIPAATYDAKAVGCDGTTEATIQIDIKN